MSEPSAPVMEWEGVDSLENATDAVQDSEEQPFSDLTSEIPDILERNAGLDKGIEEEERTWRDDMDEDEEEDKGQKDDKLLFRKGSNSDGAAEGSSRHKIVTGTTSKKKAPRTGVYKGCSTSTGSSAAVVYGKRKLSQGMSCRISFGT